MQECNGFLFYRSAMGIYHRVPSPQGLLDGRTEITYSDKAAQVQSSARESEALWTFWLFADVRSLSVCPNSISYTPVNSDRVGPLRFHFSFCLIIFPFFLLNGLSRSGMYDEMCWVHFSWPLVCVRTHGVMVWTCIYSVVQLYRGFPTCP